MTIPKPNPGSDEALDKGCCCPVLDNAHGMGAWGTRGDKAQFWINSNCPLHGTDRREIKEPQEASCG